MTSPNFPSLEFIGPGRSRFRVDEELSTGRIGDQHLFGGAGLAASILAIEDVSDLPVLWANVQFLAAAPVGSQVDLEAAMLVRGRTIGHARLDARVEGRPVFSAMASVGRAEFAGDGQWATMPPVPPPDACSLVNAHRDADKDIHASLEIRVAEGRFGIFSREPFHPGGRVRAWMRNLYPGSNRAALAMMSDFIPSTVGNALGVRAGGNSLDNHIRFCAERSSDWILGDFAIDAVAGGVGHGHAHLFGEQGELLALASQSFRVRMVERAGQGS